MSDDTARRLVMLSITVTFGLVTARAALVEHRLPTARSMVGTLFAGIVLSALADGFPAYAGPLSALMLTSVVLTLGPDVFPSVAVGGGNEDAARRNVEARNAAIQRAAAGTDALPPDQAAAVRAYVATHPNP